MSGKKPLWRHKIVIETLICYDILRKVIVVFNDVTVSLRQILSKMGSNSHDGLSWNAARTLDFSIISSDIKYLLQMYRTKRGMWCSVRMP